MKAIVKFKFGPLGLNTEEVIEGSPAYIAKVLRAKADELDVPDSRLTPTAQVMSGVKK